MKLYFPSNLFEDVKPGFLQNSAGSGGKKNTCRRFQQSLVVSSLRHCCSGCAAAAAAAKTTWIDSLFPKERERQTIQTQICDSGALARWEFSGKLFQAFT